MDWKLQLQNATKSFCWLDNDFNYLETDSKLTDKMQNLIHNLKSTN